MAWRGWEDFQPPYQPQSSDNLLRTRPAEPKRNKYGAKPMKVDGRRFASTKEAERYQALKLRQTAGEIHALSLQPRFPLDVRTEHNPPVMIGEYRADFQYCECRRGDQCAWSHRVIEDVKGLRTPLYKWKKKHVEAQYNIEIREV